MQQLAAAAAYAAAAASSHHHHHPSSSVVPGRGGLLQLLLLGARDDAGHSATAGAARMLLVADEAAPLPPHVQAGLAVAVVAVVAIAGVMSGLTLGLLSMDKLDVELMMRTGNAREEKFARRLAPLVAQPHWVLATLVICNTAAGMALPLCLDRLVNVAIALVLSTTAIVLFGEILPQAVCSRYGLQIGGHAAPFVRGLMWLTAPVSWPIGRCLDIVLGHNSSYFGRRQLGALVDLHRESAGMGGPLNEEEAHVIQGVLDLASKPGSAAMTPLSKTFMLSSHDVLDRATVERVLASGHSRLPVCRGTDRTDVMGLVLVKEALAAAALAAPVDGGAPVAVSQLRLRDLPALPMDTKLPDLLNLFQVGHSHMALLLQPPPSPATAAAAANGSSSRASKEREAGGCSPRLAVTALVACSSDGSTSSSSCAACHCGGGGAGVAGGNSSTPNGGKGRGSKQHHHQQQQHLCGVCGGATSTPVSTPTSTSKVAALLRQVSDRALQRVASSKRGRHAQHGAAAGSSGSTPEPAGQQQQLELLPARASAAAAAVAGGDLEAGTLLTVQQQQQQQQSFTSLAHNLGSFVSRAASSSGPVQPASPPQTAAAAPGASPAAVAAPVGGAAAAPSSAAPAPQAQSQAQAQAAAAAGAVVAAAGAGGLARPSAAAVWRDAGFDQAAGVPVGIITLEDVIEQLIQEPILDETDRYVDNQQTVPVNARVMAGSLPPGLRHLLMVSQQRLALRQSQQQAAAGGSGLSAPTSQPGGVGGSGSGAAAAAAAAAAHVSGSGSDTAAAAAAAAAAAPAAAPAAPAAGASLFGRRP